MIKDNSKLVHLNRTIQNDEKMHDIYGMLSKQEDIISSLLYKYRNQKQQSPHFNVHERLIKQRSMTIDSSLPSNQRLKRKAQQYNYINESFSMNEKNETIPVTKKRRASQISQREHLQSIVLPSVKSRLQKSRSKKVIRQKQGLSLRLQKSRQRAKLRQQLYEIYGTGNGPSKIYYEPKPLKQKKPKKIRSARLSPLSKKQSTHSFQTNSRIKSSKVQQQSLATLEQARQQPIQIESSDSSDGEQILPMYYQRQFRQTMKGQLTQQINFLYFSKNQAMKDWTEKMLSLLQKHDKQITSIRVKSKYLQHFDDNFWTVGIFNTDDI